MGRKPASRAHIELSMNGEPQFEHYAEEISSGVEAYIAPPMQTHRTFKLIDNKKKGRVRRNCEEDVVNPLTGNRERVRVLKGIESIWLKDQKHLDAQYIRNNAVELVFENRFCNIPMDEKQILDFIELSRFFVKDVDNYKKPVPSIFDFYEYDPERQAAAALKKEYREMEFVAKASQTPLEYMKKHFLYLGGQLRDELGREKSEGAIRQEYMLQAKRKTDEFEKSYNAKQVEINYQVRLALIENRIDLGRMPGAAHWGSGGFITKIPSGRKAFEYLTSFALSNTDGGNTFLEQLQNNSK